MNFDGKKFSELNLHRNNEGFKHSLKEWSIAEWTNALAGEAGEAANIAKKIIRLRGDAIILNKGNISREELVEKLMLELADVVIYADLTAQSENKNLWEYVVKAFNKKSEEMNLESSFRYE